MAEALIAAVVDPRPAGPPDDPAEQPRDRREATMQRIRVGVTGLAAVFLLTLLAASILSLLGQDTHGPSASPASRAAANVAAAEDSPKEPLAELGVAPGNAPKAPAGNRATAMSAPAPTPKVHP